MSEELVAKIVARVLRELDPALGEDMSIPVGISNRHVHLSTADLARLFGPGHELTVRKELSQPGQYAAEETVTLVGPRGVLERVRILGPVRGATQVEISLTDGRCLGVRPPVRDSGNLAGSPGLTLVGPKGAVTLEEGVIAALRHIHMSPADAARFGVQDGDLVQVKTGGPRALSFDQVLVRVSPQFRLEFHIDTDEANAAGLENGDRVQLSAPGARG